MPFAVFAAGFLGSAHCIGMCGPIVLAVARDSRSIFAYHLGRIVMYSLAGALAGGFASQILAAAPPAVTMVLMVALTLIIITVGVLQFTHGGFHFNKSSNTYFARLSRALWTRSMAMRNHFPIRAAAFAGGLSVFLPCGHLYTFLAASAATASAVKGAVLMGAFALGTIPALGFGLTLVQRLMTPWARTWVVGVLLIASGLTSLGSFAAASRYMDRHEHTTEQSTKSAPPRCH